jgi:phage tail tape-measure protein
MRREAMPKSKKSIQDAVDAQRNADPITGESGAHPIGAGLGAAVGGAATGAVAGAVAGPIGAAVGAAVGGIAGGLAGKQIAEEVDPTVEAAYWETAYSDRPYYDETVEFGEVAPAYRYGWESRLQYPDRTWDEIEADLETHWDTRRDHSNLDWERAQHATRDAWDRIAQRSSRDVPRKPR